MPRYSVTIQWDGWQEALTVSKLAELDDVIAKSNVRPLHIVIKDNW